VKKDVMVPESNLEEHLSNQTKNTGKQHTDDSYEDKH